MNKKTEEKMPAGTICAIIVFSIFMGLVMYGNDQKRQEKYDAAYENSMKFSQDMREFGWGLIDSENKNGGKPVQVSTYVSVPDGYMICVDDITYGEESNPKDITKLLNSMYFYETTKN